MSKELEDKAEELEQTLSKQLDLLKKDSEQWVKIGAVALAGGLIAFAITSRKSRKKNRDTEKAIAVLEKEGLLTEELEHKLKSSNKSGGFWPSLSQRLMILGLAMAKEKLLPNLFSNPSEDAEEIEKGK
ncbi:hypothetical protein [Algoriphagus machipongonensis]|uniref:Uncharacterized protein n=1 Tax=Algoriphagus machipongonensis TaxID=388413 RepID=A3HVC2_9BACT|nr:hypothetical protein [Algoriphagus machipongonensis]EAZ82094.1 hypothetical protein ALPR1_02595 [Algoriphagus machipongonensis]